MQQACWKLKNVSKIEDKGAGLHMAHWNIENTT